MYRSSERGGADREGRAPGDSWPGNILPESCHPASVCCPCRSPEHSVLSMHPSLSPSSCSLPSQTRAPLSAGSHSGSCGGDVALGIELEQQPGTGTQRGPGLIWGKLVAPPLPSPGKSGRRKPGEAHPWVTHGVLCRGCPQGRGADSTGPLGPCSAVSLFVVVSHLSSVPPLTVKCWAFCRLTLGV